MNKIKCFQKKERDAIDWYYVEVDKAKSEISWICETGMPIDISNEDKIKYARSLSEQMYGVTIHQGTQSFESFIQKPMYELDQATFDSIVKSME
jgi:hypothetical protein